jgi:hypothetical protein
MRNHTAFKLTALFLGALCLGAFTCLFAQSALAQETQTRQIREELESTVRALCDYRSRSYPHWWEREFGAETGHKASLPLSRMFLRIGLKPLVEDHGIQSFEGVGRNIIGMIEGKDAKLKSEFILIGAHYDNFGLPFAGAMDNAAGVAVMLEIARALAKNPPQRSLLFIAFDGGEQNNAGANYYAEHPIIPLEKTVAMINLTGFGGGMSEQLYETLYVIGSEHSPQLRDAVSKHKRGEAHLALVGRDVMRWPGGEHFLFTLKQTPTIAITNGAHYAYHSKDDTPSRVNYAALEKHVAALTKVIAEIANTPGKIERLSEPVFDKDEPMEWSRVLTALREIVLKTPENNAGQARIDDVLFELKRHQGRAVQDPKAREAVILRAANIVFYIANPDGVKYNALLNTARNHEERGQRQEAIAAYQKLLRFIEEESRRDDRTVGEIRARLSKLSGK